MKSSKLFLTSLLAAATLSVPAYAEEVALTNGQKTTLTVGSGVAGAGNTYTYTAPEEGTTDNGGWLWLGNRGGSGNVALGSAESNMALSGSGLIVLGYQGGDGSAPTYTFDFANTDASAFSGKFAVVNEWNNSTVAKLSGTRWSNVEYVFAGVSREQNWVTKRMYNDISRGYDTLALQDATTLAGITGTSKGYVPTGEGVAAGIGNINLREAVTVATSGTVLKLAGAGTYEFYGKVGTASEKVGIAKTGTGTQVLGGTLYLDEVTVSGGTLDFSGATLSLSSGITNNATVIVGSDTVFVLSDSLKVGETGNTYSLISGNTDNITGWNTLRLNNFRRADGKYLSARSTIDLSSAGSVTITGEAYNLFWKSGVTAWNSDTVFDKDSAGSGKTSTFAPYDNVTFSTGDVTVSVGSAVSAGTVTITAGTVSFSGGAITAQDGVFVAGTSAESIATLKLTAADNFAAGTVVTVGEHGVFDIYGKSDTVIGLVLGGGTLTNTGDNVNGGNKQLTGGLSLTANSKVTAGHNISFVNSGYNAQTFDFGGFTLTKDGTGTLSFVNTTIQNGTLRVTEGTFDSISATGIAAEKKRITLGENSRIEVVENGVMNATIASMGANSKLILGGSTASTVALNSFALGTGAVIDVSGANAVTGTLTSVGANARLTLAGTGASAVTLNGAIGANAVVNVSSGTLSGTITSMAAGSSLTLAGTGASAVTLNGAIGENAVVNVSSGTLSGLIASMGANSSLTLAGTGASAVTLNGSTKSIAGNLTIGAGSTVTVGQGKVEVFAQEDSDEFKITLNGGVLDLGNKRQTIGSKVTIELNGGRIVATDANSDDGYGSLDFRGTHKIVVNENSEISASMRLRADTTFEVASDKTLTLSGIIDPKGDDSKTTGGNTGAIIKTGAGTLVISGNNSGAANAGKSYNDATQLKAGTIQVEHNNALGTGELKALGDTNVNEVTLKVAQYGNGNALTVGNNISVSSGKTLILESANVGNKMTGAISGDGALKLNSGTLTLSGNNTFSGGVTIEQGVLAAANAAALGAANNSVKLSGGQLKVGNGTTAVSLNAAAYTIVLGDAYSADSGVAAIVGTNTANKSSVALATDTKITIELADSVAVSLAAEAAQYQYKIFDTATIDDGSFTIGSFELSEALKSDWWISGYKNGVLTIAAIPEPSMFGLLAGLGALALAGTRRRRKKA